MFAIFEETVTLKLDDRKSKTIDSRWQQKAKTFCYERHGQENNETSCVTSDTNIIYKLSSLSSLLKARNVTRGLIVRWDHDDQITCSRPCVQSCSSPQGRNHPDSPLDLFYHLELKDRSWSECLASIMECLFINVVLLTFITSTVAVVLVTDFQCAWYHQVNVWRVISWFRVSIQKFSDLPAFRSTCGVWT